ncbi:MAG TPA: UPF0149 family protein [Pseudomonadales bacterium]
MSSLLEPLTDVELARLDAFLLERIDPDSDDGDEGLISISGLDGLFTALVSGPVLPQPAQWLPVVWGDQEPEWEDQEHFETTITWMMRHLNTVAATLQEAPDTFEPLFLQDEDDVEAIVVDDWCEGYARGVALARKEWRAGGADVEKLLEPILAFSSATEWSGHELGSDAAIEALSNAITPNVRALHAFWRKHAPQPSPSAAPSPWDKARRH